MIQFSAGSTHHVHPWEVKHSAEKRSPRPGIRKNPHQTGLFLIPPEHAQVNPEHRHTAYRSSREMHSARHPVARGEATIRTGFCSTGTLARAVFYTFKHPRMTINRETRTGPPRRMPVLGKPL